MAAGCWAVPAVPTGSRLSSGRAAVTALVPLRNLVGHRALPAKISQGQRWRGNEVCVVLPAEEEVRRGGTRRQYSRQASLHLFSPPDIASTCVTAAVSPASGSRRGERWGAGLRFGWRRPDRRYLGHADGGRAAR